jgi:hypothetical protein
MPEVAKPVVTNVNTNVMKIVFLIALISSPPPDSWPASQTLCQARESVRSEGIFRGRASSGERLKMVRTTDSPWNNTQQKPHTFQDVEVRYATAVVIDGDFGRV